MFISEAEKKLREQIDMILDSPNEKNLVLPISIDDLTSMDCISSADFEDYVLKPIIQKAVNKRHMDYETTIEMIRRRLDCKR